MPRAADAGVVVDTNSATVDAHVVNSIARECKFFVIGVVVSVVSDLTVRTVHDADDLRLWVV
jgi:hypothetical protein